MAFRLQDLLPVALIMVVATIGIAVGADVLDNIQDDQTTNSIAYNITGYGLDAQEELGSWMDTIALIVAAAIIIGVLVTSFMVSAR